MKNRCLFRSLPWLLAMFSLVLAAPRAHALDDVVITEFMAENDSILADDDGDFEDWIELYNSGTNVVNLNGWYLTDSAGTLTKWRFPATNLTQNSYLVVFASNKDRRIPGRTLHTNFKLDNSGEYLALVKPDGLTIASAYAPAFPQQAANISYGIATTPQATLLISNGSPGRFTVPVNATAGIDWLATAYNDGSWLSVTNPVGFENNGTLNIADATVVADTQTDWSESGVQGYRGWYYGAWVKTNTSLTYGAARFVAYPSGSGPFSTANFWDGTVWRWFDGNPPFDTIAKDYARPSIFPSGTTNGYEHQVIRRWVSEITGQVTIDWRMAKKDPTGSGITGRIFHNNTSRDVLTIAGSQTTFSNRTVSAFNITAGDTIDFVLEPGAEIVGDDTFFGATIRGASWLGVQFR